MSRISFVPTSEWSEELRSFVAADSATDLELGITRMLAHAPELAMGLLGFGGAITTKRTLPERLIELLRLRVAFHNQCRSCMAIRYRAAIPTTWIELTLKEGRNRQVRRMTAAVGHPTLRLIRAAIGSWTLELLAPGQWRDLIIDSAPPEAPIRISRPRKPGQSASYRRPQRR